LLALMVIINIFALGVWSTSFTINLLVSSIDSLHWPSATRCLWTPRWIDTLEID
jgi:hypothetical protein